MSVERIAIEDYFKTLLLVAALVLAFSVSKAEASCRSQAVKHQFDVQQGYPHGRKGYIVDHVCALARGGLDITANMQYQTLEESIKKDRIENTAYGEALFCTPLNSLAYRTVFNCK